MTMTTDQVTHALTPFEFSPGRRASWSALKKLLPDVQTALFFAKAFQLDYRLLSELVYTLFDTPLMAALGREGDVHSTDLQDYLVDTVPEDVWPEPPAFSPDVPHGEFLPAVWESIDLVIAKSIGEVAETLGAVLDSLPSKEGRMAFQHLAKLNRQRPTIGTYEGRILHQSVPDSLVVLDVSGSMTESTIAAIVNDVVALSWKANAHLAIVSNNTYVWEPGTYGVADVLARAEYGGTQYESLFPLFDGRDWGTVITIADYDSSYSAKQVIRGASGRIGRVLDISLVNQPTYLAEVLGQLADDVQPLLQATTRYVLG